MDFLPMLTNEEVKVLTTRVNEASAEYGLILTETDMQILVKEQKQSLKEHRRIAFDYELLPELIGVFCDSRWLNQSDYAETLMGLQDLFYAFKNETADRIDDATALKILKDFFEEGCHGDIEDMAMAAIPWFTEEFCRNGNSIREATETVLDRLKAR